MSVRCEGGIVFLESRCGAEDAEALLVALAESPGIAVNASALTRLHLAVAQVLLAFRPPIAARPADAALDETIFAPLIEASTSALPSADICA